MILPLRVAVVPGGGQQWLSVGTSFGRVASLGTWLLSVCGFVVEGGVASRMCVLFRRSSPPIGVAIR